MPGGEAPGRSAGTCRRLLGDDLQDVEDQLHDDGALAQLTRPTVDDGDQSAVQVTQVLRQQRLAVASRQVAHLRAQRHMSDRCLEAQHIWVEDIIISLQGEKVFCHFFLTKLN